MQDFSKDDYGWILSQLQSRISDKDSHKNILCTWGDDEGQARDRGRLWNFTSRGSGFLWGLQLVGDTSRCPSPEGRPGACAVAPETNPPQVGDHPI